MNSPITTACAAALRLLSTLAYPMAMGIALAQPKLEVATSNPSSVVLSWPSTDSSFALEATAKLGAGASWQPITDSPTVSNGRFTVSLAAGDRTRFFRLRDTAGAALASVSETSPAPGESGVAVTRETIFRLSGSLAPEALLTSDDLFAQFGGRKLLSRAELSSDRRTATLFYLENLPASARIRVTLDGTRLPDGSGKSLDADGDGRPGGVRVLEFDTASVGGLPGTAVIGKVFASEKNADGSNKPLVNVTVTVDGAEETLRASTDENGAFVLQPAPSGRFFVHVDGRTAVGSLWPNGAYYPFVGKAWDALAGKTNNLAGGSGEIFLPLIQSDALNAVSATEETKVTFAPSVLATNPNLAGVEVNVPANSLFGDNGARGGKVGIAPVPPDRLPEPLPPGLNFPLVITVQTDGGANFDRPVPVKFPNLPDPVTGAKLPPGAKSVLWSFNHDTGRWEPQGTMTISADGRFAVSDPGVGIRQPGWHGAAAGSGGGGPGGGPSPQGCPPYCGPRPDPPCSEPDPCGHLHFLYREALENWQHEAELKESFTIGEVVALGREVDKAYQAYVDCREANGRPCEGQAAASTPSSRASDRGIAKAGLPNEAGARFEVAIRNTIDEQNAARSGSPLPGPGAWFALRSLDTGFLQRGRLNNGGSVENLILAPNELYRMSYYDAANRRGGTAYFRSRAAGEPTYIPHAILYGAEFGTPPDADSDGLSDFAERVLGSSSSKADSDGDGIKDGQELANGTNPLDGTPAVTGLVAGARTPGAAVDVYARGNHAFVAVPGIGLVVFELRGFDNPTLVSQFALGGDLAGIAGVDDSVLLATQTGATLVDIGNPASPRLIAHANLGRPANAVAANGGQGAVALDNGTLAIVDMTTGEEKQRLEGLDGDLQDVKFGGNRLFVLSEDELIALERTDGAWSPVGRIAIAGGAAPLEVGRKLIVNGNLAWVGYFTGFSVVNIGDPAAMTIVGSPPRTQLAIHDFALTGSGDLAAVTSFSGTSSLAVSLYDVRNPADVTKFLGSFQTLGTERALVVHRGLILVAAGTGGLQVVNFHPPDLGDKPPTVSLVPDFPGTLARAEFGGTLPVTVVAEDDVGIRSIELEVDGVSTRDEGVLPLNVGVRLPAKSTGKTSVSLRARATDLAGNSAWSAPVVVPLVDDATPPLPAVVEPRPASKIVPGALNEVFVTFTEAVASPVTSDTLVLVWSGPDLKLGTADDATMTGVVSYDAITRTIALTTSNRMAAGKYSATLAAGIADSVGNQRAKSFTWQFETGALPRVQTPFPPSNYVRVGGVLDELRFTFDQPVPRALADTYVWKVTRQAFPTTPDGSGPFGRSETVAPLQVQRSTDGRTFALRGPGSFPSGGYVVTGSGPNVQAMRWEFYFRDFPNEARSTSGTGTRLVTNWKWFPGPGEGDELIVNLPGQLAPIEMRGVESLLARSDILFNNQTIDVASSIQALAGLEIRGSRFGPGVTDVHGPLVVVGISDLGSHVLNARGGGHVRGPIELRAPDGALVNHPGSTLVLSNTARIAYTGLDVANAGRLVNLGTLRALGGDGIRTPVMPLDGARVRNDGRFEVATGGVKIQHLDNEGLIDVAAGSKLFLPSRARGGVSSRFTGEGDIELGEYDTVRRRVVWAADAEIRGDFDTRGNITLTTGELTLWRPFVHPAGLVTLQNSATLRLLGPATIGLLAASGGVLECSGDTEIGTVNSLSRLRLRGAEVFRVKNDAKPGGSFEATGKGLVEFMGTTTFPEGSNGGNVVLGDVTLRNRGTWRYAGSVGFDS
ncbi:MAG: Ig-like domain-containing protein, partial [Verrucomicrobiales bacterium]|nr:Ig-like domain-containing protein [Verrucomicrobiales bacterium]